MKRSFFRIIILLAICLLIFFLTSSSLSTFRVTQSFFNNFFDQISLSIEVSKVVRKTAHVLLFGILAIAAQRAMMSIKFSYRYAWIFATVFGALDEFHQMLVPDRTSSIVDIAIDSLGAFIALFLLYRYLRFKRVDRK